MRRDRVTIALYAHFVAWGWLLYSFSPSVPLLGEEQGITKAQAGLHGTAMAIGTLLSAFFSARLVDRFGRRGTLLLAGGILVLGVGTLMVGTTLPFTLLGAGVTAMGGTLVISAAQPALSVHHREASAAAVVEANGVGSLFGLLAPLAVGASVAVGWGWRPAVAVTILLAGVAAVLMASLPGRGALGSSRLPDGAGREDPATSSTPPRFATTPDVGHRGFTRTFWFFWVGLLMSVAVENATTFWAADLLITRTGAGPGIATGALAGLLAGMSASRFVVGPMSMRRAPEKLLLVAFAVAGVGWAILWTATATAPALIGLVIAGFGYGAQYPLSIALVLRASQGRPDKAQARATFGAGAAVGVAPFLLGALADTFGSHTAFLLVPVLIAIGAGAVALGLRSVHHPARAIPASPSSTR
ncbi:MFS transporter [Pengzhenrongella frigida]|uniref:MFS transporter n=1 Tax=Pengzhenrongella frigida TaxID=1259133 RepID=A0A4Q5MYE9_9MICO|nr:MFS transporter [Cellulomonas sp. HLT2-17]